jgi:signal transduction histidine kinase
MTGNTYIPIAISVVSLVIIVALLVKSHFDKKNITASLLRQKAEFENQKQELERLNEDMKAQNQKLQSLHQVNNQIFSIISHDLRSPLGSIKGFLRLMQITELSAQETKYFLNELEGGTNNTLQMLDTLLQWARNQMNGIQPQFKHILLNKLILQVVESVQNQATLKGVNLSVEIKNEIKIVADEEMLKLVIRNLLTNAIKFTKAGGFVSVAVWQDQHNNYIAVKDTGIGLTEEQKNKLFNPEKAFSLRGTSNEKGTGLGLIICKEFIEKHKGTIQVESELNKGSTFSVALPVG